MTEPSTSDDAELQRLGESPNRDDPWRLWGPYLSGRQWGTVREDYSADGDAWEDFTFNQAHLRAYRWGEDGIAGICDRHGLLNFALAVWNGSDDRLKERLFGLTNSQGNHGEDVKEYWWHQDATPTHSYAQFLYRYPQRAFPYRELVTENARRTPADPEYELADTGIFDDDRFFDITVTHAKASPTDIVAVIDATNHGPDAAPLHLVPQLWFRNTWSWGHDDYRPAITRIDRATVRADDDRLGTYYLTADGGELGEPQILFCDNESDSEKLWQTAGSAHPKSAVNDAIVHGDDSHLSDDIGTKVAFHWSVRAVAPGDTVRVRLRLTTDGNVALSGIDALVDARRDEADTFYAHVIPPATSADDRLIARRAFAGLLWCKQFYRFDVAQWLDGDPGQVPPAPQRRDRGRRNVDWRHLALGEVIMMPDEWEYPWFAAWDLAFHCVAMAHIDPDFAKSQLLLLCRPWAMHPDGQLPAYEWDFGNVNPPVHAWAAWQIYRISGATDIAFLERMMAALLFNYGWWINRTDPDGDNLFGGGFLGMDNIGVFDRSSQLPGGAALRQSDATSWMAFADLCLLRIAWELARGSSAWDDTATVFLDHFLAVAQTMRTHASDGISLWDDEDGFYYDAVVFADGSAQRVPIRSLVGLLPLLAVGVRPDWVPAALPSYRHRLDWLRLHRPEQLDAVATHGVGGTVTLSLLDSDRRERLVAFMLNEAEFLSPHGIRSLSAAYVDEVVIPGAGSIRYEPGESESGMFGGNSNWRGPVWMPINVLLADSLRTYAEGLAVSFEYPTGSGTQLRADQIADAIDNRLVDLFRLGPDGRRPGTPRQTPRGPLWDVHPTFSEYFHGDTGAGLGASHQTGWTALVAHLICLLGS